MLDSQTAIVHEARSQEIDAIHNLATQAQQRLGTEGQGMIKMLSDMQDRLENSWPASSVLGSGRPSGDGRTRYKTLVNFYQ